MTVPASTRAAGPYTTTGGETLLPYGFKILAATDLAVYRVRSGAVSLLILTTDYTVTGIGEQNGGNVTLVSPALAGDKYLVEGNRPNVGTINLLVQHSLDIPAVNAEFDSLEIQLQEARRDLARAIVRDRLDASGGSNVLPAPQAGKGLAWKQDGTGFEWVTNQLSEQQMVDAGLAAEAAAQAAQAAAAASASAASTSQSAAAISATAAASSQTAAAASATAAAGSQAAAATAATNAASSATTAAAQASNAATSETNASTSAAAAAASAVAAAAVNTGTSSTSQAVASGSKTFTTQSGKQWSVNQWLVIVSAGTPTAYMIGQVSSYSGTTLTLNVTTIGGSGTYTDWNIGVTGVPGVAGASGGAITLAPAYANFGGQGNRTATIKVAATAGLISGTGPASNLVNGGTATNYTDSVTFNAVAVAGLVISFDFGFAASKVVNEITFKQNSSSTHGVWQVQASNDGVTWAAIGSTFTLGGSTAQAITTISANTLGYRYWALAGVSGTASASPYIEEIEFKIGTTILDGVCGAPAGGAANALLTKHSSTDFDVQWTQPSDYVTVAKAIRRLPACVASYWPCDEGKGTVLRDIIGSQTFDWTVTGTGGTVGWATEGRLKTQAGYFKTPSQLTAALIVIFRVPEGPTQYFCNTPNLAAYIGCTDLPSSANATLRQLDGWGVRDIPRRTTSGLANDWCAGGWNMVSMAQNSATTGTCCIGGYNYNTSFCTASMEIEGILVCSTAPSDTELRQILNYVREEKRTRSVFLTPWDCPRKAHLVRIVGESTGAGTALLSSLADRASNNELVGIQARNNASAATTGIVTQKLVYTAGYANADAPADAATKFGLERGLMLARIERFNDGRPLHIAKIANGSTYLVPPATYSPNAAGGSTSVPASACRYPTAADAVGLITGGMFYLLEWRNTLRMERQARNSGIGYTSVTDIWCEGLNDAYIGTIAVPNASTYQAYMQEYRDRTKDFLGISNLKQIVLKPHQPSGGLGGGDPDYPNNATGTDRLNALNYIRTACDNFATANSADVQTLDGNSYPLNTPTDYTHPTGTGYETMGRDVEARLSYTIDVVPRA